MDEALTLAEREAPPEVDDRVVVDNPDNPAHGTTGRVLHVVSDALPGFHRLVMVRMDHESSDCDWRMFDAYELREEAPRAEVQEALATAREKLPWLPERLPETALGDM